MIAITSTRYFIVATLHTHSTLPRCQESRFLLWQSMTFLEQLAYSWAPTPQQVFTPIWSLQSSSETTMFIASRQRAGRAWRRVQPSFVQWCWRCRFIWFLHCLRRDARMQSMWAERERSGPKIGWSGLSRKRWSRSGRSRSGNGPGRGLNRPLTDCWQSVE